MICLDKSLELCEGVEVESVDIGCLAATDIASEALSKLLICQTNHKELINCVKDYNKSKK